MLHSIATGNMLPANVKVIIVDINQPTVTKLMDRGTWQALGIVSDAGAFLPMVVNELQINENQGTINRLSGLQKNDIRKIPPKTPVTTPDAKYKKTIFIHKIISFI